MHRVAVISLELCSIGGMVSHHLRSEHAKRLGPPDLPTGSDFFDSLCEQSMSHLTRFPVGGEHLRDGGGVCLRRGCEHLLNCTRDSQEGDTTFEECLDSHFVCCIEGNAVGSALFGCFKSEAEAGEPLEVWRLEIEVAEGG